MNKVLLSIIAVLFLASSFYKKQDIIPELQKDKIKIQFKNNSYVPVNSNATAAEELYSKIAFENINTLSSEVFYKAYLGFENLKKAGKLEKESHFLTVIDFSLSSAEKRLWVIDLNEKKVIFNSLVAHGKNTGEEFATNFSNTESSLQSSLGFYITESTYNGANGYSLKLLGMDDGYNNMALQRAIVMHGADYVSEDFIKSQKRLGRSWGCPAVPRALAEPIINTIKGQNCIFIYYPDAKYIAASKWLVNTEKG